MKGGDNGVSWCQRSRRPVGGGNPVSPSCFEGTPGEQKLSTFRRGRRGRCFGVMETGELRPRRINRNAARSEGNLRAWPLRCLSAPEDRRRRGSFLVGVPALVSRSAGDKCGLLRLKPGLQPDQPDQPALTSSCSAPSGAASGTGVLTVSTGQGARRTTPSATLPISSLVKPVQPCVPITMRSQQ